MANTEGLSDEAMQSYLSINQDDMTRHVPSTLRQRMELPMGERPAATVVRKSPRNVQATNTTTGRSSRRRGPTRIPIPQMGATAAAPESSPSSSNTNNHTGKVAAVAKSASFAEQKEQPEQKPQIILGGIVERKKGTTNSRRMKKKAPKDKVTLDVTNEGAAAAAASKQEDENNNYNKERSNIEEDSAESHTRSSVFAKERLRQQESNDAGFPSLNQPLGFFTKKKSAFASNTATGEHRLSQPYAQLNEKNVNSDDNVASSTDAMLAQMSPDDVQESLQELQQALSPETLAFLKQRGRAKFQQQQQQRSTQQTQQPSQHREITQNTTNKELKFSRVDPKEKNNYEVKERAEKERISKILSSVKTYQDLDVAYAAEIREDINNSNANVDSNVDSKINPDTVRDLPATDRNPVDRLKQPCELLRSSAQRQKLWAAKHVAQYLHDDLIHQRWCRLDPRKQHFNQNQKHPIREPHWPLLLPVSLRCLLDTSFSSSPAYSYVLYTYCLQSIYFLLQLRACADHVIDVSMSCEESIRQDARLAFQLYFLNDAVPTPSLASCYSTSSVVPISSSSLSQEGNGGDKVMNSGTSSEGAAAYATLSSSTSAESDGEAFLNDPMWTLLSKMKMIPRLAQILQYNKKQTEIAAATAGSSSSSSPSGSCTCLPKEAFVSICGILSMIAQRSPGAATAIVQHKSLLPDILGFSFPSNEANSDASLCSPVVIMLGVLSRQSRVAAQEIANKCSALLLRILVRKVESGKEFQLQQFTLILWRTLLRYGLCLESLSSLLSISTSHIALGLNQKYSLAADFLAAFAVITDCANVAKRLEQNGSQLMEEIEVPFQLWSQASAWLSSSLPRQVLNQLENASSSSICSATTFDTLSSTSMPAFGDTLQKLKLWAGGLRFLASFLVLSSPHEDSEDQKSEDITGLSMAEHEQLIELLNKTILSDFFVQRLKSAFGVILNSKENTLSAHMEFSAAECCYLESIIDAVIKLVDEESHPTDENVENALMTQLVDDFVQVLCESAETEMKKQESNGSTRDEAFDRLPIAAKGWYKQLQGSIVKLLAKTRSPSSPVTRALAYSLIGRLALGDEGPAAIFFSYDSLFIPLSKKVAYSSSNPSPISTMFVRELCTSPTSRNQLDHSFKLHGGLGITSQGTGPFGLQTLLSEGESASGLQSTTDMLLPLGKHWLWQTLSGAIIVQQKNQPHGEILVNQEQKEEAINIMTTGLQILVEIEVGSGLHVAARWYAGTQEVGAKLYHLTNVCLQPEDILANEQIQGPGAMIALRFASSGEEIGPSFSMACHEHCSVKAITADSTVDKKTNKQLTAALTGGRKEEIQTLQDLAGDLCDAFIEFGAQYRIFVLCLRVLLQPSFPPMIRCTVLNRTRGLFHLLTNDDDEKSFQVLLGQYLLGGLPLVDGSLRDAPEFQDELAALYSHSGELWDSSGRLVATVAVSIFARQVAIGINAHPSGSTFSSAARRRILKLQHSLIIRVFETAAIFLKSSGTKEDLVQSTLASESSSIVPRNFFPEDISEEGLGLICIFLADSLKAQRRRDRKK